jgi:hypothetical protein
VFIFEALFYVILITGIRLSLEQYGRSAAIWNSALKSAAWCCARAKIVSYQSLRNSSTSLALWAR